MRKVFHGEAELILVIDAGTTSTRAMLFALDGTMRAMAQRRADAALSASRLGRARCGGDLERRSCLRAAGGGAGRRGGPDRRDRHDQPARDGGGLGSASGEPLARAIVWQDRRTAGVCDDLRAAGHEGRCRRTGLLLDPYFSATKMRWLLDNVPEVRGAAERGTAGASARRVLAALQADRRCVRVRCHQCQPHQPAAADIGAVGRGTVRAVRRAPCGAARSCRQRRPARHRGRMLGAPVPVTGLAGDQQAATIGQGCLAPGETKATYGTGAFVLANMGAEVPRSAHRLVAPCCGSLAASGTMRSKARSSWPEVWCSGCATAWG
jgi:glycerol kinase